MKLLRKKEAIYEKMNVHDALLFLPEAQKTLALNGSARRVYDLCCNCERARVISAFLACFPPENEADTEAKLRDVNYTLDTLINLGAVEEF